uniref:Membrane insertase YidC/Oxa/ALB C-terminal domain-containing protein n=1 Tax=Chromera velia CCMP2878 TaxID=1169474 RepID=A0A0G4I2C3_9ALVE|eukprot:Cvel_10355.t1-p1 / transcript=Cvel_10355.t1 / gene=Cvel_10355 / organism=Chromera_velia_CCMP2878 / gene_product=hypothetical protein / transcript_product=hypothetical protein / location=Cvel_scaffold622:47326-50612(+) / protein_length=544 / sequence_SO=supercontig / SO=protein_coding / is_pseudo=false
MLRLNAAGTFSREVWKGNRRRLLSLPLCSPPCPFPLSTSSSRRCLSTHTPPLSSEAGPPLSASLSGEGAPPLPSASTSVSVPPASLEIPEDSHAAALLERCMEAAKKRGADLETPYEPSLAEDFVQTFILLVRETTGCSWLWAIFGCAFAARLATVPLQLNTIRQQRKSSLLKNTGDAKMKEITEARMKGSKTAVKLQEQYDAWAKETGYNTGRLHIFLQYAVQLPLFFSFFRATRGLADRPDVFMSHALESSLWLDSLSLADPYGLLGLTAAAMTLTNQEMMRAADRALRQRAEQQRDEQEGDASERSIDRDLEADSEAEDRDKRTALLTRVGIMGVVYITSGFPASTLLIWAANSAFTLGFNAAIRARSVERLLNLPPISLVSSAEAARQEQGLIDTQRPLPSSLSDSQIWNPNQADGMGTQPQSATAVEQTRVRTGEFQNVPSGETEKGSRGGVERASRKPKGGTKEGRGVPGEGSSSWTKLQRPPRGVGRHSSPDLEKSSAGFASPLARKKALGQLEAEAEMKLKGGIAVAKRRGRTAVN